MRCYDAYKVSKAIETFLGKDNAIDPIEWVSNQDNITLENDNGDLAVFEYGLIQSKIYCAHYYFKSRGRLAITVGKDFLDELFNTCYNVNILIGMAPLERKDVRWMTRQLGLKSYGFEEIHGNHYELFIITKKEFNHE